MKKLNLILIFVIGLMFVACKDNKDDEPKAPSKSGILGLWYEGEDSEEEGIYDLLITNEVWLWNPRVTTLVPYKNSSYKELAERFAPDDEFLIYRYDSSNNVYLLYESTSEDWDNPNAKIVFQAKQITVAQIKVSDDVMDITMYYYVNNPNFENVDYEDALFSYEEIMSNPQFGTLANGVQLGKPEFITYKRYK